MLSRRRFLGLATLAVPILAGVASLRPKTYHQTFGLGFRVNQGMMNDDAYKWDAWRSHHQDYIDGVPNMWNN